MKCIVFGAGGLFEKYSSVIEKKYEILVVSDNDSRKTGGIVNGYKIITPQEICNYPYQTIIICSAYAKEIQLQLLEMGIKDITLFITPGLFCDYGIANTAKQIRFFEPPYKKSDECIHILFTQISPCTRTNRFAQLLFKNGIKCSLAYFGLWDKEMEYAEKYYEQIIPFFSYKDLIDYVENSDYDLIHCSNEPDILACLLHDCGKPIVHDCHDFLTLRDELTLENMAFELMANSKSDGYIYPSRQCMQIAIDRYGVEESKAIYMENLPSKDSLPLNRLTKLSSCDGEIHCVYEGTISDNPESYRFFENQWKKLASLGIHVHFYTNFSENYCRKLDLMSEYIHYEGNVDIRTLLTLMTQYDVGLCTYVELLQLKIKLNTGSPNKLYEYLAAGLPVAASNLLSFTDFFTKYSVGKVIDWDGEIKEQLYNISRISIQKDFIICNYLTIENEAEKLVRFYMQMISDYKK